MTRSDTLPFTKFYPSLLDDLEEDKIFVYLKYVLILSAPTTSDRIICPLLFTSIFTLSTTSKNTYKKLH